MENEQIELGQLIASKYHFSFFRTPHHAACCKTFRFSIGTVGLVVSKPYINSFNVTMISVLIEGQILETYASDVSLYNLKNETSSREQQHKT